MTALGRHPWHFVSAPLSVDLTVTVLAPPHWTRPTRTRLVDDVNNGPPTVITRGGALGLRRLTINFYVPSDSDLSNALGDIRDAIAAVGPYTLTTHRNETLSVVLAALGSDLAEDDESTGFVLPVGIAEVG